MQVACTLGTIVFTSILFIRGIWAGVAYVQESRNNKINELADDPHAWNGVQQASLLLHFIKFLTFESQIGFGLLEDSKTTYDFRIRKE